MLGKMTIVNVGIFFRAIWTMVKGFIDPKTQSKINLLKSNYKEELLKLIDQDKLPKFFGGTCTCDRFLYGCLGSDIGPWNPEGGINSGGQTTIKEN